MKESTTQKPRWVPRRVHGPCDAIGVLQGIILFPESGVEECKVFDEDVSNRDWTFRLSVKS